MKAAYVLFLGGIFMFLPLSIIYTFWTYGSMGEVEPVGAVGLLLLAIMSAMIGLYVRATSRKLETSPSDVADASIDEAAGDYGFFSPYSWWPLYLASAALLLFLGLAIGWWIFVIGAVFGALALVGWAFQYFTGEFA